MSLILNQTIVNPGNAFISFNFTTNCISYTDCYLSFYIDNVEQRSVRYIFNRAGVKMLFPIKTNGPHIFRWSFIKSPVLGFDHWVSIDEILIVGTNGGAAECATCLDGKISGAGQSTCSNCPKGEINNAAHTACNRCPADTYAPVEGSSQCYRCDQGTGTSGGTGASDCDYNNCQYEIPRSADEKPIRYDLSPLSLTDSDWGPVRDASNPTFSYYLNLCNRYHNNSRCQSKVSGASLETFVCQLTSNEAFNLGEVMGFYQLPNVTDGILIRFSQGANCALTGQPRMTNLTILCDPFAGVAGVIDPMREVRTCVYATTWRTSIGCYVCTEMDYEEIVGECVDGLRLRSYKWRDPHLCLRGVPLPLDNEETCVIVTPKPTVEEVVKEKTNVAGIAILSVLVVLGAVLIIFGAYKYNALRKQKMQMWAMQGQDQQGPAVAYNKFQDDDAAGGAGGASINK